MGNTTLEPEGNSPAPSAAGTGQVAVPNNVIVADLNALAAQIDSAIAAASGIKAFCDLVQPVHDGFVALSNESPPAQTPPSASDLNWWERGLNGAYEVAETVSEAVGVTPSQPDRPYVPSLEILQSQAADIDVNLQALTGTQGFGGIAIAVHESLLELESSLPDPVQPSASDLTPADYGEPGDGTTSHYPQSWTPGAPR